MLSGEWTGSTCRDRHRGAATVPGTDTAERVSAPGEPDSEGEVSGRIRFTDEERRSLAEAALAVGRSLMREVVSIVKPETILAWQRRLEQKKWDYVNVADADQAGPGHAERWVCSVTGEYLDHLILFGMSSLQRALRIYRDFFNGHRPHQGIGNRIPERRAIGEMSRHCAGTMTGGALAVECQQFLGGLLNSHYRKAA